MFSANSKMESQPSLTTPRLVLRPFVKTDALRVQQLAGDIRIADVTANIPHPYPDSLAETWIGSHSEKWEREELATFTITIKESDLLVGCISLMNFSHRETEIGYWVGVDYWGNGYATEACKAIVRFGFGAMKLDRVHAHHLSRNPASGRVLAKTGLVHIGSGSAVCGYQAREESIERHEKFNTQKHGVSSD
jgi:[ribosomal protein S5]-alanine N-acetyltransferase